MSHYVVSEFFCEAAGIGSLSYMSSLPHTGSLKIILSRLSANCLQGRQGREFSVQAVKQTVEQSVEQPVEEPVEEPTEQPVGQPIEQPGPAEQLATRQCGGCRRRRPLTLFVKPRGSGHFLTCYTCRIRVG